MHCQRLAHGLTILIIIGGGVVGIPRFLMWLAEHTLAGQIVAYGTMVILVLALAYCLGGMWDVGCPWDE